MVSPLLLPKIVTLHAYHPYHMDYLALLIHKTKGGGTVPFAAYFQCIHGVESVVYVLHIRRTLLHARIRGDGATIPTVRSYFGNRVENIICMRSIAHRLS